MDAIDSLRSALSDPSLAYLLLMLAVLGISVEILTPGLIFPSTIGIISGLFAFLALSTLPINPIGIILIFVSLGFFIAEAVVRTRGRLPCFGLISIILGSIFLFRGGAANRANPFLMQAQLLSSPPCWFSSPTALLQHSASASPPAVKNSRAVWPLCARLLIRKE